MPAEAARFMWLFCFFDLPVKTKPERKAANRFRVFLKNDGFDMLQLSVYVRVCKGQDAADKHLGRICANLPKKGSVRTLVVTDRQYGRMRLLVGEKTPTERAGSGQLVLL